ncbi:MAG: NAD-dependent epimerase/dehydratase family protein [Asgard group archaeon]|nr:NAD-dependent epimerase/dehydratase family protein [Asgard group archaeon]
MEVFILEVLVIGGSRFSGRKIIELLVEREHSVTVLNRGKSEKSLPPFYKQKDYIYPEGVKIIHADRTNVKEFTEALKGNNFTAIIDTCAFNENQIQNVLDISDEKLEHYVFISTASVYDEEKIEVLPINESAPFGSEADDCPVPYSRDKRRAESLLMKKYKENNYPITIIRPTYIYGPNNPMYREYYFFDRIMDQKNIYMPGNGEYLIDFVNASDVAWLATAPLENRKAIGQSYNATGEGAITLNNYVKAVSEIIDKKTKIIHYDPKILEKDEMKPENWNQMFPFSYNMHFFLSKEKAALDLGYEPIKFIDGLKQTFDWYLQNRNYKWKGDYVLDKKIVKEIK